MICTVDVDVATRNKIFTIVEVTVVVLYSKHAGSPVIGHNNADIVHVVVYGTVARNAFGHLIEVAV